MVHWTVVIPAFIFGAALGVFIASCLAANK